MSQLIPITQLALPIPAAMSDLAWQQAQAYRSSDGRWNFYLNSIASQLLAEYLVEDFPQIRVWQETNTWQFVNGSVLELNGKRIVLLPSRSIDNSELAVPQEWLDIPDWAGDYFLAVQIDSDTEMLHCWGYMTHQMLKSKAAYDASDRTYSLNSHYLIPDVSGLWVIQELNPTEVTQTAISPLPIVATIQAENLLQRLGSIPDPRLEIPFELWGALICDRNWRQQLAELRQGESAPALNRLSGWIQNVFATGWQAVEDFLGEDADLAFALRQTTTDVSTMRRVKALELADRSVLLLISAASEADDRLSVQVQLRSRDRDLTLPEGLTIELLSGTDEVIRSVTTRDRDNAIQLPRFRLAGGTEFKIRLQLNSTTLSESFVV
jgi:hypothetical protein